MKRGVFQKSFIASESKIKAAAGFGSRISVAVVEVGLTNRVLCSFRCFGFDLLPGEDGGKKSH